jgi:septal ring factor EnvC (AmiA/AmiB activator)
MDINWTLVTIAGALLAQGAAVVWAVSSMVSDIQYNRAEITDVETSTARLADDIHENDVMIARIDANVEAIKDALNVVTTNHAKR